MKIGSFIGEMTERSKVAPWSYYMARILLSPLIMGYGVMAVTRVFGTLSPSPNLGSPTITGDLRCGNRYLRGVRLVNSSYGNKPKEFESLRLTIK